MIRTSSGGRVRWCGYCMWALTWWRWNTPTLSRLRSPSRSPPSGHSSSSVWWGVCVVPHSLSSKVREVSKKDHFWEESRVVSDKWLWPFIYLSRFSNQFETLHSISLIDEITLYLLMGVASGVLLPACVCVTEAEVETWLIWSLITPHHFNVRADGWWVRVSHNHKRTDSWSVYLLCL